MHYYQHHIGDFIRDTANLTDSQVVSYLRLIWMYYDTEAPLPDSAKLLAFKVGSDQETIELLLESFFKKEGDFWRHTRIESEISSYREKGEKARENANKRWNKSHGNADAIQSQCDGNSAAMQTQGFSSKVDANQEPITNNQYKKLTPTPPEEGGVVSRANGTNPRATGKNPRAMGTNPRAKGEHPAFAAIWAQYPKRPGASRASTLKAFNARVNEGVAPETMLFGVRAYAAYCAKAIADPKHIKQPETFFGPGQHYLSDWSYTPPQGGSHARHQDTDNSAPAKVRRAIAEREARRQAEGTGPPGGEVIDGEFTRTAF